VPLEFHHLAIHCGDLAACERFYRTVLGLEVLRRWPREGGGDRSVWLAVGGGGFLALERADPGAEQGAGPSVLPAASPGAARGLHLLALRIDPGERAAWETRFEEEGVPVVRRTRWTIYVQDPEGNRIGLSHHPHEPEAA
jgi:catechol 2,3-dioxygenase-like lactoylglutathione lyase family enzyme